MTPASMSMAARVRVLQPPIVDTHAHVFAKALRLSRERRYTPDYDATLDTYLRHLAEHGIGHAVLVQPSFLGTDNAYLLQALSREPRRLKGVAVLSHDVSDDALRRLHEQGVTGVRLNLVQQPLPDLAAAAWGSLWRRLAELGWHVELHREARDLVALVEEVASHGLCVVVDHFGRPDPQLGTEDPGFEGLLRLAASRQVWVKLSGAYRCAAPGSGFVREATRQLLAAFGGDRLMWGSDWPHTQFEQATDYAESVASLQRLGLDGATLDAVMRETPHAFYGFDTR